MPSSLWECGICKEGQHLAISYVVTDSTSKRVSERFGPNQSQFRKMKGFASAKHESWPIVPR